MPKTKKQKPKKKQKDDQDQKKDKLTLEQEAFCLLYVKNRELFGNATMCYAEAYGYKVEDSPRQRKKLSSAYKTSMVCGSKLLRRAKINQRITELFNELMNDEFVDGELAWVIAQKRDIPSKVRAVSEYNKVKGRIIERQKHEFGPGKKLIVISE